MMPTPRMNGKVICTPKIDNCNTALWQQPDGLSVEKYGDYYKYVCHQCVNGTFWQPPAEDDFESQGTCRHCSEVMPGCTDCHSETRCLDCQESMFLTYKQDGCMKEIDFCRVSFGAYTNNGEVWTCPECVDGYFINVVEDPDTDLFYSYYRENYAQIQSSSCTSCNYAIDNCWRCTNSTYCTLCYDDYFENSGHSKCHTYMDNCETHPYDMTEISFTNEYGEEDTYFMCDTCEPGYYFRHPTEDEEAGCYSCKDIDPLCEFCDNQGKCKTCKGEELWMVDWDDDGFITPRYPDGTL